MPSPAVEARRIIARRKPPGRPPKAAGSPDQLLVARACLLFGGLSRVELARLAGMDGANLSRKALAAGVRERLQALVNKSTTVR